MPTEKMSTPVFGDAVQKFRDAGVSAKFLIPVAPPGVSIGINASLTPDVLGKAPGRYHRGKDQWGGLSGKILVTGTSREDFEEFETWPTGNVGVLGKAFPGIDSDAQNEAAARVVARAIHDTFRDLAAVRLRGKNHRLLYAYAARNWKDDPVRTRHITYKIDGVESKLDIIGNGGQYLIAGIHPSGDEYGWENGNELYNPDVVKDLLRDGIDNKDIGQFLDAFEDELTKAGGEIVKASGGGNAGDEYEVAKAENHMPLADIYTGLDKLPNSPDNFLHRDDFVAFLSKIRAAAGKDGSGPDFEDRVREWATAPGDDWCSDAYFDKVWRSLDRVRTPGDALDRFFRQNGIFHQSANQFDARGPELSNAVGRAKDNAKAERGKLMKEFVSKYVLGDVNTKSENANVEMRPAWDPSVGWNALDWWNMETSRPDVDLVRDLNAEFGLKKPGFWEFMRETRATWPEAFYFAETKNPLHEFGHIVKEHDEDSDRTTYLLNMRHISATIRHANRKDPDPKRSARDVKTILEFVNRLFGKMANYELDTIAYMAQTGKRPGSMLFLVGDTGVGKSTYTQLLVRMFNGARPDQVGTVDGAKVVNESAARFAFAGVEGCRIVSIKELPKGGRNNSAILRQVTSSIKQMVDAGPEGDYFSIEGKGKDILLVRNFARIIASSNHADSIEVETGDRRIFMVVSEINQENKPDEAYYQELVEIINDPERLAAFYRYLLTHDISRYSPNAPPPVSSAKAEAQTLKLENPVERHMRAAVAWFEHAGREAFDAEDLAETMTKCSANEAAYLGNGDKPVDYAEILFSRDPSARMSLVRQMTKIKRLVITLPPSRSGKERDRTQYVALSSPHLADKLAHMARDDRAYFYDQEAKRGLHCPHPWVQFRKAGE
jgi:hypothetical protein